MLMRFLYVFWDFLLISSEWIIISLLLSGIIHAFVRPQVLQKSIGNKKISSLLKTTISGAILPICSCGVLPLALSLYRTGAYLGPTLSFLVATPIINPAAIIMSFAMLMTMLLWPIKRNNFYIYIMRDIAPYNYRNIRKHFWG